MSPLLRHPGIVPSLFSIGTEHDMMACEPRRLTNRMASVWTACLSALSRDRTGAAGRCGSVLAGVGIALLVCGRPLLQSALPLVDLAPIR